MSALHVADLLLFFWLLIGAMFIALSTFKQGWVIRMVNRLSGWLVFFNTFATAIHLLIRVL